MNILDIVAANAKLTYDTNGLHLTELFEGRKLVAYQDGNGVWTIGDGHTGADVHPGMVITDAQADALLLHDVQSAENFVKRVVKVLLNQWQFNGLVDLTFNIGVGNFLRSTVLAKLNGGDTQGAAAAFLMWDKVAGKVNSGLQRRRLSEEEMFLHGVLNTEVKAA